MGPVAVARRVNEWWNSVPFEALRESFVATDTFEDWVAHLERGGWGSPADLLDVDIEINAAGALPGVALLENARGLNGWHRFWREWLEPWDSLVFEHAHAHLWTDRDGRAVRVAFYPNREQAMEALRAEGQGQP